MKILQSLCKQSIILIEHPEQNIFTEHFILTLYYFLLRSPVILRSLPLI